MDVSTVISMISSVGFPIVACIGLYFQMTKQDERHEEEIKELREVIEKNTLAIIKLCDKLGVGNYDE